MNDTAEQAPALEKARERLAAGQPAAALELAQGVIAGDAGLVDGLHVGALALAALGRRAEALTVYGRAAKLDPAAEGAAVNRGGLLREMGRVTEAAAVYRALLAHHPQSPEALLGLSLCAPPEPADLPDEAVHQLLGRPDLTPAALTALLFAKANRHHWQGNFQAAFLGYREANALQREAAPPYDLDAFARTVEAMKANFTAQAFAAAAHWGSDAQVPVFVAGLPRSGKTTLEALITGHPAAHGAGELRLLQDTAAEIEAKMSPTDGGRQLHRGSIDFRARTFLAELRRRAPDAERIVDTNANNLLLLGFAALMFPRAPVIFVNRDPLETGLACYTARFVDTQHYATSLTDTGRFIRLGLGLWAHWKAAITNPVLEVEFGELTAEPARIGARVLEFLDLPGEASWLTGRPAPGGIRFRPDDYTDHLDPLRAALQDD